MDTNICLFVCQSKETGKLKERNWGIDILRILSMFFVVLLHNLFQGGILENATGLNFVFAWHLENLSVVAVNVFAMITGYLMVGRRIKLSRVVDVIIQAMFWSWIGLVVVLVCGFPLSTKQLILGIAPITMYWYVNAYVGLSLIAPFIIKGLETISKHTFRLFLGILLVVCVTAGYAGFISLEKGYSPYWLIVLFLVGAYVRLFPEDFSKNKVRLLLGYLILPTFSTVLVVLAKHVGINPYYFSDYTAPIVVAQSISLFAFGTQIDISSTIAQKLIGS